MKKNNLKPFFLGVVAPSILAILLFVVSFFSIIIPQFEKQMMDHKKEMIKELTQSAWSIVDENNLEYESGLVSLDSARIKAALQIEQMRYGLQRKDYFWIIDNEPKMVMHPYRKELNGKGLTYFKDSKEKHLFVEAKAIVEKQNEGFIDYYWQWKDDTSRVVPKLSYVMAYEPWSWIIGTGIYLDDVALELAQLKNKLISVSAFIVFIIFLSLLLVIRQSLNIENKRKTAEDKLILSKEKYKTLVNASSDATLMFINDKVVYSNNKFAQLIKKESEELMESSFHHFFTYDWSLVQQAVSNTQKTYSVDTQLILADKQLKEVVVSVSEFKQNKQLGYIVVVKDVSPIHRLEKSTQYFDLQVREALLFMNQPVMDYIKQIPSCSTDTKISEIVALISRKNVDLILVKNKEKPVGVICSLDIVKRAYSSKEQDLEAINIMTAPLILVHENAMVYDALLKCKAHNVSHVAVVDFNGKFIGLLDEKELLYSQQTVFENILHEVEQSQHIDQLRLIFQRIPVLVKTLISGNLLASDGTRIIASVADAISKRVIELAIEQHGNPPCDFAFIAMGSEGREEQTLKTDQDNALILSDKYDETIHGSYFEDFANTINYNLNTIGYKFCKGEVMANQQEWRKKLSDWDLQFAHWISSPDPQNVLDSSIFFDYRLVYGSMQFSKKLQKNIFCEIERNDLFLYHMANSIIKYSSGIVDGAVELKKLTIPLVGYARILALKHSIPNRNTIERLSLLCDKKVIALKTKTDFIQAYNLINQLRLNKQCTAIMDNDAATNEISIEELSAFEQILLKKSIEFIQQIQNELAIIFRVNS